MRSSTAPMPETALTATPSGVNPLSPPPPLRLQRNVLLVTALLALLAPRAAGAATLSEAEQLLRAGKYAPAEAAFTALAKGAVRARAALGLARVQLETGRYAAAAKTARGAATGKEKAAALTLVGEAQRLQGQLPAAEKTLQEALAGAPRHYRALAWLGLVQLEQGKVVASKASFDVFYDDYGADKIKKNNAELLTYVAMACRYSDNFRDASDTYRDAAAADDKHVEAYLQWAEISLEKYEAGYAEKHYQSVLKINPQHADALVGLAQVKLEQANDVEGAGKLLARAEQVNPQHLGAKALRAFMLLDAEEHPRAEALLQQALRQNPNHLDTLALLGASHFLRDDPKGYEQVRDRVLKLNPRHTKFFRDVVVLAVRHHRYAEAIALSKQAITIDPRDWYSLADLGQNYLRLGDDASGLAYLQKAWKGDAFNVRTFNLLNLYEDIVAKQYVYISSKHFKLRVHKQEQELLRRTTIPLLERAYEIYARKYKFTPAKPIIVELFRDQQHYAVRTVGLPGLAALGVCFGQVITSISPANGRFNWGQVLWHELNHVFTIQLSRSRVPRWLTEGLADMEPVLERAEWKRENDFDIYRALKSGKLKGLGSMNTAFTQAKSLQEMVVAYYQGSLMVVYLIKAYGLDRVLEALRQYGKGKRTEEILPAMTRATLVELDSRFRSAEEKRLAYYSKNWYVELDRYDDLAARQQAATARPTDAAAQAELAAALVVAGKIKEADAQAQQALKLDPKQKLALYIGGRVALMLRDAPRAAGLLALLVTSGGDGYEPREALGSIALEKNDLPNAERHLAAAKRLDPERATPYRLLAKAYEKAKQPDKLVAELKGFLALEQMSFELAMQLTALLGERKDWAGVRQYGLYAYYIHPASVRLYRLLAQAHAAPAPTPQLDRAVWYLETALLARPEKPAELHVELAKLQLQRKDNRRAREHVKQALQADPEHREAKELSRVIR